MAKIGFVSLGCAKNLVDSEVMMGLLVREGHQITPQENDAEVIVVNTCGFIDRAKEESIDAILEMARQKESGKCRRLVVAGCLVERYRNQIQEQIPEVDAVIGVNEVPDILKVIGDQFSPPPTFEERELYLYSHADPRLRSTPRYMAYVKIAEGCDHPCTFCVIPKMRGRFRSRSLASVVKEVQGLVADGVREVNLVAQDTTMYGWDQGDRRGLANLIRSLDQVEDLGWIRFLYAYPNSLYPEILEAMADCEKACHYVDIPLQSASRNVLKRMKRGGNRNSLIKLIGRIRNHLPDVAIRTTMIVGFPGESEEEFLEVLDFVREAEFDRLGVFTYSDEEDSESYYLKARVPEEVKQDRKDRLMELQRGISRQKNSRLVGQSLPVLIEGPSKESELLWQGRTSSQAPEIDGGVYLTDGVTEQTLPGDIVPVEILEAYEYDLVGRIVA